MVILKVAVDTPPNYILILRRNNHGKDIGVYEGLNSAARRQRCLSPNSQCL